MVVEEPEGPGVEEGVVVEEPEEPGVEEVEEPEAGVTAATVTKGY